MSFLENPDPSTEGMSLADRTNIDDLWARKDKKSNANLEWKPMRKRWFAVASTRLWLGIIIS